MLRAVTIAFALAAVAAPLAAASPEADLQASMDALVSRQGGPPGAIAIVHGPDGNRVLAAGTADLRTGAAPRPGDRMRLASVAKAYSGAAALRLVARGRLSTSSTIGQVLPSLPSRWSAVTLAQLLHHTSGLPDYSGSPAFRAFLGADARRSAPPRRLVAFVGKEPLEFRPGSTYRYSNTDNVVVGLMVARVTGESYNRALQALVARPLGLSRTVLPTGLVLRPPAMLGYGREDNGDAIDVTELFHPVLAYASGGLVATPLELGTFIRAYVGGRLFGARVQRAQAAWRPGRSEPEGPGVNAAGLGLFRYTTRCGVVYGHTGNTAGYTQFAAATRDGRRSITVSVNQQLPHTPLQPALRRIYGLGVCAALGR